MKALPKAVSNAWDDRQPIVVLSTVSPDGIPNSIYVGSVGRYKGKTFFVANNCFSKTKQNIQDGSKASILFMTHEMKSYQLKGSIELRESGPIYEAMKKVTLAQYPALSVAVLSVEAVFSGAEQLA